MTIVALRLADETVDQIDRLVAGGWTVNRTAFMREAIETALARAVETQLDRQIADALASVEETSAELRSLKSTSCTWIASLPDGEW